MTIRGPDSDEDNFDIVMDTSGKLSILRPVLRPELLDPMISEVRSKCIDALEETLNTFYPEPAASIKNADDATNVSTAKVEQIPTWLMKWAPQKAQSEVEPKDSSKTANAEECASQMKDVNPEIPNIKVKRRLQRRSSDLDNVTSTPIQRNGERNRLIEKASSIFNTIDDSKDDGVTIAGIITHMIKFGECWVRFPKTTAEVNLESAEKLIYVHTKLGRLKGFLYTDFRFIFPTRRNSV